MFYLFISNPFGSYFFLLSSCRGYAFRAMLNRSRKNGFLTCYRSQGESFEHLTIKSGVCYMLLLDILRKFSADFSGGPVAKILCYHYRGPRFNPWSESWDLHTLQCANKERKFSSSLVCRSFSLFKLCMGTEFYQMFSFYICFHRHLVFSCILLIR